MVVAAPSSGSGKTTVATGLMAALRRRGCAVAGCKVGPDYIDPGYHALATGRPGRNLDPVLVGERRIAPLAAHGAAGADVVVVEGVMGLFDGRSGTAGHGSTAQVAALLGALVLLVVDASGQGRSLAALLHGFSSFDPGVRIAGVVLNRLGSQRHEEVCREACAEAGLPVLGALRRDDALAVPSRHLGLVTAAEHTAAATTVEAWADAVAAQVDLDAVLRLAGATSAAAWQPEQEVTRLPGAPVVALAGGPAFAFGYAEHAELLAAAGAVVAPVDPLRDEALPPGAAGLVLPGGFPEEHAAELSANAALRGEVAALARSGAPVHAECGGLLYLARELDGLAMCGVLDVEATMTGRLTLGYRDAVALSSSSLHPEGARVAGHEFHRTTVTPRSSASSAWGWAGAAPEGFVQRGVHASFLHTHPAGSPAAVARFVASCSREDGS
ncbi:MAG: cobyrinate a,c-diamide synthase [Pseudonocardiaceae bacterium]